MDRTRPPRSLPARIGCGLLRLLIEAVYWPLFASSLLGFGLRFVLLLPIYVLNAILVTLEWIQWRLTAAKINLLFRDDEPTRQLMLAALLATLDDDEPNADES